MAIDLNSSFPTKSTAPSASYPTGSARNVTTPGDGTGTPWHATIINDLLGFQQAIIAGASLTPSGSPDTAVVSQYLQGLKDIMKLDPIVNPVGIATATFNPATGAIISSTASVDGVQFSSYTPSTGAINIPIAIPSPYVAADMSPALSVSMSPAGSVVLTATGVKVSGSFLSSIVYDIFTSPPTATQPTGSVTASVMYARV